jgi:hypothetical protein
MKPNVNRKPVNNLNKLLLSRKLKNCETPSSTIGNIKINPANAGICRLRKTSIKNPKKPISKPVQREHSRKLCPAILKHLSGCLWQKNANPSRLSPKLRSNTGPALASQIHSKILLFTWEEFALHKNKHLQ